MEQKINILVDLQQKNCLTLPLNLLRNSSRRKKPIFGLILKQLKWMSRHQGNCGLKDKRKAARRQSLHFEGFVCGLFE
jgi:hypothetical protein